MAKITDVERWAALEHPDVIAVNKRRHSYEIVFRGRRSQEFPTLLEAANDLARYLRDQRQATTPAAEKGGGDERA